MAFRIATKIELVLVLFATVHPLEALADPQVIELAIHEHHFDPAEVHIPANTKVKLVIKNHDATAEEFESYELKREKVIGGNAEGVVYIGPLPIGTYPFFGDFNRDAAQGRVIAE